MNMNKITAALGIVALALVGCMNEPENENPNIITFKVSGKSFVSSGPTSSLFILDTVGNKLRYRVPSAMDTASFKAFRGSTDNSTLECVNSPFFFNKTQQDSSLGWADVFEIYILRDTVFFDLGIEHDSAYKKFRLEIVCLPK